MLIALCAGETSGDQLGAGLIHALRARHPQARFVGIGGPLMAQAGMECWFAADELAVMGLVEVLRHLPRLLKIRRELLKRVKAAGVELIEIRLPFALGGKAFVVFTGEVSSVRAGVNSAVELLKNEGVIDSFVVIPSPHKSLIEKLL